MRARGVSFTEIASELKVARSTLVEWSRQLRFEIQNEVSIEMDALLHQLLGPRQHRARQLAERFAAVEGELRQRQLNTLSTVQLYRLSQLLRREILRETDGTKFVSPIKDIPKEEYIETVQEWKS
jgi:hypothetical protein